MFGLTKKKRTFKYEIKTMQHNALEQAKSVFHTQYTTLERGDGDLHTVTELFNAYNTIQANTSNDLALGVECGGGVYIQQTEFGFKYKKEEV